MEVWQPRVAVNMDLRGERRSIGEYSYLTKLHYVREERNQRFQGVHNHLRDQFLVESSRWKVYKTASPFNRRVTCIEWHPSRHDFVAFASHGGTLYLWNIVDSHQDMFIQGEGYGYGAITQMLFKPGHPLHIYTTSVNGTFSLKDFEGRHSEVYLDTMDIKYWWTSLALSTSADVIFVGGNTGRAVLLNSNGKILHQYLNFHKDKIHHAEFCPASDNLLATSSNDKTVSIWDIRYMGENTFKPLATLKHQAPISSVTFDPVYGSRLLTTAHNSELRVYDSHNWEKPTLTIKHPHRHFQHMTNIKANWHPFFEDICIVGRYAESDDPDKTRCVDLIDLNTGVVAGKLCDPMASQIMVVNKFNKLGSVLATGMGYTALLWHMLPPDHTHNDDIKVKGHIPLPGSCPNTNEEDRRGRKRRGKDNDIMTVKKKKLAVCSVQMKHKKK